MRLRNFFKIGFKDSLALNVCCQILGLPGHVFHSSRLFLTTYNLWSLIHQTTKEGGHLWVTIVFLQIWE